MVARASLCMLAPAAALAALAPEAAGVLALAAATVACAAPADGRDRLVAIEDAAVLLFLTFMFGVAGAGGFAVMRAAAGAAPHVLTARLRPATALAMSAMAGVPAVLLAARIPELGLPASWSPFAAMAPALALAAPERAMSRLAAAAWGAEGARQARLAALGPLLVALVVGAGAGGLAGAAIGWSAGRLAIPLAMLCLAPRRRGLAWFAMGVLAAAATATVGAALPVTAAPALAVAACVFGLRVHAPAAARRLRRLALSAADGIRPPTPASVH